MFIMSLVKKIFLREPDFAAVSVNYELRELFRPVED